MALKRKVYFLLFTAVLLMQAGALLAQPGDPGDGDPDVPITGVEYLIGGGVLYGIRSMLKARKKQSD